jgi:hypothetical protein
MLLWELFTSHNEHSTISKCMYAPYQNQWGVVLKDMCIKDISQTLENHIKLSATSVSIHKDCTAMHKIKCQNKWSVYVCVYTHE